MTALPAKLAEPTIRKRLFDVAGTLTTPVMPDEYASLFNPLWSVRELRGRIEQITPQSTSASTIVIRPGRRWPGHVAGQHLAIGVDVNGVRHWRSYSLTSDPGRADGCISITVKAVDDGIVSPHLVRHASVGDIIRLGPPEGDFTLRPEHASGQLLFITAGSGITPVMAMLRALERTEGLADVVHLHSDRTPDEVIFGRQLRELAEASESVRLVERHTGEFPRFTPAELDALCPDWRERDVYACGPRGLLDAVEAFYEAEGKLDLLHLERFELALMLPDPGDGGTAVFKAKNGTETVAEAPAGMPLLVAGEDAGLLLENGCRMGICHRCACELTSGQVRDLRTGEIHSEPGEYVQLCVSAAAGDVEIKL